MRWRTNRAYPFTQLRDEVDKLMGEFLNGPATAMPRAWAAVRAFPAINLWEEGDQLFAEAELPGLKSEDVDISVSGDELTLSGRRPDVPPAGASFHRRERGAGDFSRTVRLPFEVDAEAVEATLRDGVLTVKLPKSAAARPRKIKVGAG